MKWLKRGIKFVLALVVLSLIAGVVAVNPFGPSPFNRYQREGILQVPGLKDPVRVVRDEKGMAYIHATNRDDLCLAQGYVTAQDRLFQMELTKRFAAGRIGELAGIRARNLDIVMRTLGFHHQAQRHVALLDSENRKFFQKYVDGINAFIETQPGSIHLEFKLAGIRPEPWQAADALSIMYYMGWNSAANIKHEIVGQLLVEKLGFEKAALLFPLNRNPARSPQPDRQLSMQPHNTTVLGMDGLQSLLDVCQFAPLAVGSNNWVVNGQRSQSGKPIVANDPHLEASLLPGPWYPCGLISPQVRAVGVTIPGTPGMVAGRTRHLAYGITNAYGDAQDLYMETVDPRDPDRYLEGSRSIPFKIRREIFKFKDKKAPGGFRNETHTVRSTRRGPVISEALWPAPTEKCLTVRWAAFESMGPRMGFGQFLTCRNAAEFRQAVGDVTFIALNFVFADMEGQIGWHVSGRLPIRSAGNGHLPFEVRTENDNWQGWVPFAGMPHDQNPAGGWIGTTNHKTVGPDTPYEYSNYFATAYRQERLIALMQDASPKEAGAHWQFQRDTLNHKALTLAPIVSRALRAHPDTQDLGQLLMAWDCRDDSTQVAPTLFHAIFSELARRTYRDDLGEALTHEMLKNNYFWEERLGRMMIEGESDFFDDLRTTDQVETLEMLLQQSALTVAEDLRRTLGEDPADWQWGRLHRYEFVSPIMRTGPAKKWLGGGDYPADGSGDTLCRAMFNYDDLGQVKVMASLRMVSDLGDPHKILAVLPGGVTGRQFDPHTTDQIAAFIAGTPMYWWFSDAQIGAHQHHELILRP